MGKFLNSCLWVGNLTLFQALAGGSCYHLYTNLPGNLTKKVKCLGLGGLPGGGGGMGGFGIDWYITMVVVV